jgi:hypothetical protein
MIDFEAQSSKAAIEALEDSRTRTNLLKFGVWLVQSEAEDLLSRALLCVCDPQEGRPWDREQGSFGTHMRIVMRDLARLDRRAARARREVADSKAIARAQSEIPSAEDAFSDKSRLEWMRRMAERLRERLLSRGRALRVLDARVDGVERAEDLARLLDCPVEEIYDANRQIAYHAAQVLADERTAEATMMKAKRERAMKGKPS